MMRTKYHCKREGKGGCKCTCDAHPPCVVKQGYVLRECKTRHAAHNVASPHAHALQDDDEDLACNRMLHGNAYPNVPNMQDCCNMCTNHPKCDVASRRVVQSDASERHRTLLAGCGSELRRLQPPSLFVELTGVAQLGLSPREWPTCIMLVSEESRVLRSAFFLTMRWAPERGAGRRTA